MNDANPPPLDLAQPGEEYDPDEPHVGDAIGGYMLVDIIASGGMGRVWRAVNREGALFAMKTMLKDGYIYRKRLEREAQIGMILDHPNLVKLIDCDLNFKWPYLVQELLIGVNLRDLYRARRRLPEQAVMYITYELAKALNQAFGFGIIHRDIKPDNCFLTSAGHIKMLDLGLAKVTGAERLTRASDLVGTIQFMAPEQIEDASRVDHRVDIWSLGVMAFLFLTGQLPHRGRNVQEVQLSIRSQGASFPKHLNPQLSPAADHICSKMTSVNPSHRYRTPAHLLSELEQYFANHNLDAKQLDERFMLQVLIPEERGSREPAAAAKAPEPAATPAPDPAVPTAQEPQISDEAARRKNVIGGSESYKDQDLPAGGLQFD